MQLNSCICSELITNVLNNAIVLLKKVNFVFKVTYPIKKAVLSVMDL